MAVTKSKPTSPGRRHVVRVTGEDLHKVDVRDVDGVDPVSLIAYDKVMVTVDAVKKIEEMLG